MKLYNDSGPQTSLQAEATLAAPQQLPDWLVPDWPVPANVRAVCTSRNGGVSQAPWQTLNLGVHVGDNPAHVQTNRQRLQAWLATHGDVVSPARAVFLDQVHGFDIVDLDNHTPDAVRADGAVTGAVNLACTVMVADCLPVLLCNAQGSRVAAVHAGWRGLVGQGGLGVLDAAVPTLDPEIQLDSAQSGTLAWLGPCIGPTAFEVGDEVRAAFVAANPVADVCFVPSGTGKWLADLPALARQRLLALGITRIYGNDGSAPWCTFSNPLRFFSHRRDRVSGRMAASIWRVG